MNNIINNQINKQQVMETTKSAIWSKVGTSIFHLVIYIVLMTAVSSVAMAQCSGVNLACNNNINISTNDACIADISLDIILSGKPSGFTDQDYSISLKDANDIALTGTTINADGSIRVGDQHVGMTIKACATLAPCGLTCWGYINIEDKVGPRFTQCNSTTEFGLDQVVVSCNQALSEFHIGEPLIAPGCTDNSEITYTDLDNGVTCNGDFAGQVIRTWTVSDSRGNATSCTQEILIERLDVSEIVFPENFIFDIDGADCDSIPSTDPSVTGEPTGLSCPNIMNFYTDIGTESCGLQVKLIRDWFVIDWCTGTSVSNGQVIKIRDVSPPVSVCPLDRTIRGSRYVRNTTGGSVFDTLYVPSLSHICSASVTLDPLGIIDSLTAPEAVFDCSAPLTIDVSYKNAIDGVDPTTVPFIGVAQNDEGLYPIRELINEVAWVRYCFTDACGNGAEVNTEMDGVDVAIFTNCCFFEIRVNDNNPPNAICEGFTKIPLSTGGMTTVFAETFDDHSFDPCGAIDKFEVRREVAGCNSSTLYGPSVDFCCEDLGDTITVFLKVTDAEGNFSECPSRVCVTDSFVPQFSCPEDVTIDCLDSFDDLDTATGTAGCSTNFRIGDGTFDLSDFNVSCNTGVVVRKIFINDLSGNIIDSCFQNITVLPMGDNTQLEDGDYTFPDDITIDVCNPNETIHPDQTGYPTTDLEFGCIDIGISFEDSNPVLSNTNGSCYRILRTWTVVDWCRYDPNNPDAFSIIGSQSIEVTNSGMPTLECPDMQMVTTDSINCIGFIDLNVIVSDACIGGSSVNWMLDADADGTIDLTGNGDTASGEYPVGSHSITFTVANECGGGMDQCTFNFQIKGNRPPLPICRAAIGWTLNENGEALVWASDFDLKSEGGCDGLDSLSFSFVPTTDATYPLGSLAFDCDDLDNGAFQAVPLEVFIVDESGVSSSCSVILNLQDSQDVCQDVGSFSIIAGGVMTENAVAVENVMVELENMTNSSSNMIMTDTDGDYAFAAVEYNNDYTLAPENNENPLAGVSTLDLVMMQRHILGIDNLDSPYKLIAADINSDNRVDGIDLVELRKLILGVYSELPQNESWLFVPQEFNFINPELPWSYETSIDIEDLIASKMDANFVAIKVGDVNNSAEESFLNQELEIENRNSSYYLSAVDYNFSSGDLVSVPFIVEESGPINGIQMTLKFDSENLLFQGIDQGRIPLTDGNFALLNNHDGVITISYANANGIDLKKGDHLFNIYFESSTSGLLSEMVSVSSEILKSEVYSDTNEAVNLEYIFRDKGLRTGAEMEVFQNLPNPFADYTRIAFSLPSSQEVSLKVFNAAGKLIHQEQNNFEKGINEFVISSDQLSGDGILIYRVESGTTSVTRKMIFVQ